MELNELIERSKARVAAMSPAELEAMHAEQRKSWARGMARCEHDVADWETCPECRSLFPEAPQPEAKEAREDE